MIKNLEKFSSIFIIAGFVSFLVAFCLLGLWPALMVEKLKKIEGLPENIPAEFQQHYPSVVEYQTALKLGRDIYIKEACWHCHSQYVRPVGNESVRYGLVSTALEYQNELNLPQLFGTRRVGPDLTREAGKRTNDWHLAHLYNPKFTEPQSIMPRYPWLFDDSVWPPRPKKEALALVAYLQNLGKWATEVNRNALDHDEITMPPDPLDQP